MRLGIDIDGVVADFVKGFLPKLNEICQCPYERIVSHDFAKNLDGIEKDRYEALWNAEVRDGRIFAALEPIESSGETLAELITHHTVLLITSRPRSSRKTTEVWLRENRIPYSRLEFATDFSDKIRKLSSCDLVLEDELEVARMVESRGVPVVLFNYPWNSIGPKITRVENWQQARRRISAG